MDEKRRAIMEKEIDLIEACITRMAQNSFMIKGWTISLVAVVLALLPERFDGKVLGVIGVVSTICFWYLDSFYLYIENLYRTKYEWIIKYRMKGFDDYLYDLNPHHCPKKIFDNSGSTGEADCNGKECALRKKFKKSRESLKEKLPIVYYMLTKTEAPLYFSLLILSAWFTFHSFHCI